MTAKLARFLRGIPFEPPRAGINANTLEFSFIILDRLFGYAILQKNRHQPLWFGRLCTENLQTKGKELVLQCHRGQPFVR